MISSILCIIFMQFAGNALTEERFHVPNIEFEAFKPKGLLVKVFAQKDIQQFAVNANINESIQENAIGAFSISVVHPEKNGWSAYDDDIQVSEGDVLNYWVFFQSGNSTYKSGGHRWIIKDVQQTFPGSSRGSMKSKSEINGKKDAPLGSLVFEENFSGTNTIDTTKWIIEHYIPSRGPDFEFCSYQNRNDLIFISNETLIIKPKVASTDVDVRGKLDLTNGCTRDDDIECSCTQNAAFILPPVTSAQIRSKLQMKYGKVEIRAKMPQGDWIFPQMYLEPKDHSFPKIWIGYARGNEILKGSDNSDIGGSLLFGGVVVSPKEPERSKFLSSYRLSKPLYENYHTYTVSWNEDQVILSIDGSIFGTIDKGSITEANFSGTFSSMRLVLGVGVGGVNDFPDYFKSKKGTKPWTNYDRRQVKAFFSARNDWLPTWNGNSAFQIDYVKIYAL